MTQINDGMRNLVSRMGTERDKAAGAEYYANVMTEADVEALYEGSYLAKKVVNIPAYDAGRGWRAWQGKADQIEKIEAEEKRLGVKGKLIEALRIARLRGGAAILIGTGETQWAKPLKPESVKAGGVKFLTVLPKNRVAPEAIDFDATSETYGKPTMYTVGAGVSVHPSRLVILTGDITPGKEEATGYGNSVLQTVIDAIRRDDAAANNAESLTYEAKVDVIRAKGLTEALAKGGAAAEQTWLQRFQLMSVGKGINGVVLLDENEQYDQKNASFGGLDALMDRFALRVSAAADIPLTRLYGQSAAGMNATGEGDLTNYYDSIASMQELTLEPALAVLDECLIRSALGNRPPEVHFNWRPLWTPTDEERARVADTMMSALAKAEAMGVNYNALARAAVNVLTEVGLAPGLEGYVEEEGEGDPRDDLDAMGGKPDEVADAAPRTLYVSRKVVNASDLIEWAKGQGFKTTLPADDLHVTIAYSRAPLDWMKVGETYAEKVTVSAGGPRIMEAFGANGEAKVLQFASNELVWRHEDIKRAGASWDWPDFQPHITISYDPDAPDVTKIEPYRGEIVLGPEIFAEVNENWKEGVSEE